MARQSRKPLLMQEIADLAGVSKSTVSRALSASPLVNDSTREAIVEVARKHGYRLNKKARNIRSSSTLTIAVVVQEPERTDWSFTDPFFLQLLGSIANELDKKGHDLLLANIRIGIDEWINRNVVKGQCDGAILLNKGGSHDKINTMSTASIPIVAWGGKLDDQEYCSVGSDNRKGGRIATLHLLEEGRRNICFAGQYDFPELALRYSGYEEALNEHGLEARDAMRLETGVSGPGAEEAFYDFLARSPAVDGVVAASDVVALGIIRAALKSGLRVPEDLAVVGYDDIALAKTTSPSLSTIRQDCHEGAKHIVQKLLRIVDGTNVRSKLLEPELVVRESSTTPAS